MTDETKKDSRSVIEFLMANTDLNECQALKAIENHDRDGHPEGTDFCLLCFARSQDEERN